MEIAMIDLNIEFEPDDQDLVIGAINHFGEGNHPWAGERNLQHFGARYAANCCELASQKAERLNSAQRERLDELSWRLREKLAAWVASP